jgi:integrase
VFPGPGKSGHVVEIKRAWKTALQLAGIADFHFHDLRHTTATRLTEAGEHPVVVMEIMGHSDPKTTKRYSHGTMSAKRAALAKLETFEQKAPTAEVLPFRKVGQK